MITLSYLIFTERHTCFDVFVVTSFFFFCIWRWCAFIIFLLVKIWNEDIVRETKSAAPSGSRIFHHVCLIILRCQVYHGSLATSLFDRSLPLDLVPSNIQEIVVAIIAALENIKVAFGHGKQDLLGSVLEHPLRIPVPLSGLVRGVLVLILELKHACFHVAFRSPFRVDHFTGNIQKGEIFFHLG